MIINGITIPTESATANDWTVYYDMLEKRYGMVNARQAFSHTFAKNATSGLRYDQHFRQQMQERGVDITTEGLDRVMADLSDANDAIWGFFGNTGNTLVYGLVGIALLIAIVAVAVLLNPQTASVVVPQARALKALR